MKMNESNLQNLRNHRFAVDVGVPGQRTIELSRREELSN